MKLFSTSFFKIKNLANPSDFFSFKMCRKEPHTSSFEFVLNKDRNLLLNTKYQLGFFFSRKVDIDSIEKNN